MQGVSTVKTYAVEVTREGRWWMIEVPEIDGLTQARRIDEIEAMTRSLIATIEDVLPSSIEVNITSVKLGDVDALAVAQRVKDLRAQAVAAEAQANAEARAAALTLTSKNAPVRDVGTLLGVSHQRVSQLTK